MTSRSNSVQEHFSISVSSGAFIRGAVGKNPRKLTPRECARLQGFPESFLVDAVSPTQIYKQFGNSVCVSVVRALAKTIVKAMKKGESVRSKLVSAA